MKSLTQPAAPLIASLAVTFCILHSTFLTGAVRATEPRVIELWPEGVPGLRGDAAPDKDTPAHSEAIHTPTMLFHPAPKSAAAASSAMECGDLSPLLTGRLVGPQQDLDAGRGTGDKGQGGGVTSPAVKSGDKSPHSIEAPTAPRVSSETPAPTENCKLKTENSGGGPAAATAVIICPGGGYARLSMDNEGRKVAAWLNSIGVTAFVLKYRLKEYGQPEPLRDVLRAIRIVRKQAAEFGVRPDRVGVLGFSAGGHLASCAATLHAHPDGETEDMMDETSARPDFAVLVYPVISMREGVTHKGSRENLLGKTPAPAHLHMYSTDEQVTKDTPPVFLVSGTDDKTVPVENSVRFFLAMRKAGVPVEMHLFQQGPHGFSMKTDAAIGPATGWPALCEKWLRHNGWLETRAP